MMNLTRETVSPPLCVLRREVAEHVGSVDRAVREFQLARAGTRTVDQRLSDRLADLMERLQSANSAPLAELPVIDSPVRCARPHRVRDGARRRRSGSATTVNAVPLATSPRQPRLRLYAPTSPV
jgi:hypothetical protein